MEKLILSKEDEYILKKYKVYYDKSNGYYRVRGKGSGYIYLHRLILGATKGQIVDHKNRNKHDNRRENLRIVSHKLNNYNQKVKNPLGRGIYFDKFGNRFRACLSDKNKTLKLGSFKTINEAKIAYNKKALEMYGVNAFQHNIINNETQPSAEYIGEIQKNC